MLQLVKFLKDALLAFPVTLIFQPISKYMAFIYYYNKLILWIRKHKGEVKFNDFYVSKRDYNKRFQLYQHLVDNHQLNSKELLYLEFGVAAGHSFKWWLSKNTNASSSFHGFDTFEGLPENWGTFDKGAMSSGIPVINDNRGYFIKGLFQDTLTNFIQSNQPALNSNKQKLIHMDADLYTATAFALSQLYPYIKKGDIIMFDEFTVAMHEFKAFDEFVNNFHVKLVPIASVNNFYQTAFIVA